MRKLKMIYAVRGGNWPVGVPCPEVTCAERRAPVEGSQEGESPALSAGKGQRIPRLRTRTGHRGSTETKEHRTLATWERMVTFKKRFLLHNT